MKGRWTYLMMVASMYLPGAYIGTRIFGLVDGGGGT